MTDKQEGGKATPPCPGFEYKPEKDDAIAQYGSELAGDILNCRHCNRPYSAHGEAKPEAPAAQAESREAYLLEVLVGARDVIASLQKQLGFIPNQNAYSTKMTAEEINAARAVKALDEIIDGERTSQPFRPKQGPCSCCGDGDTAMEYHSHEPARSVEDVAKEWLTSYCEQDGQCGWTPYIGALVKMLAAFYRYMEEQK